MRYRNLLFVSFLIGTQIIQAQTADIKLAVDLGVIKNEYNGDYGNGIFNFNQQMYPSVGIGLGYYLSPSFNLGIRGSYGDYGFKESDVNYFRGTKLDMSLYTQYKLNNGYILKKDSKLSPFLTIGLGFATYGINSAIDKSGTDPGLYPTIITRGADVILPVGAGLKYQISDRFAIQYQYLYNFTSSDIRDENRGVNFFGSASHPSYKGGNDAYGQHIFSIVFNIGKYTDTDRDGVPDKYDKCPNTPINVKVDKDGCPIDTDSDGVADYLDKCPNTPKGVKVDANGCPLDTDGDGVPDYLDKCPDTPKGVAVDANGCPLDADGDGVPDYLDKCPNTPAGVAVDASGCPLDTDGDGVPDYLDKCPDTPAGAKVDSVGCPIDSVVLKTFQNIEFEFGSEKLTRGSYPTLDQIAKTLKDNSITVRISVAGYTDYIGSKEYNMKLSVRRANSVRKYLLHKKVPAKSISIIGYGKEYPIATNKTSEGRRKNRRVEFKMSK